MAKVTFRGRRKKKEQKNPTDNNSFHKCYDMPPKQEEDTVLNDMT
jgi:hypothetical protein